jgi:MFS family permease
VKNEFALSDSQVGVLAGLAFSISYGLIALPAGALADRTSRRKLIAAALGFWTLATAVTGLAQNYVTLLLARMGVGLGEGCGQPPIMSSVADLFPPEKRATAISIYYLNAPLAALIAGVGGGILTHEFGWRVAMAAVAAPGFVLCLVMLFCPEIPRSGGRDGKALAAAPPVRDVLRFIGRQRAILHLLVAVALVNIVLGGMGAFAYSFFIRYHHMSIKELGLIYGLTSAVISLAVILGSGLLADKLGSRDPRSRLWMIVVVFMATLPLVILGWLLPQPFAFIGYLFHLLFTGVWLGPAMATVQNLSKPHMRSTTAAIMFISMNLVGVGFGPVIAGALSDAWKANTGSDGLRFALICTTLIGFWAVAHFYMATRTLPADLERAQEA